MVARIESIGYEVGYRLVERTCQRRWMGGEQLEAIKFVCKDLWSEVRRRHAIVPCVDGTTPVSRAEREHDDRLVL